MLYDEYGELEKLTMQQLNPRSVAFGHIDKSIYLVMTLQTIVQILFLIFSVYTTTVGESFSLLLSLKENVIGVLSVFAAPSFTFLLRGLIRKNISSSWKKDSPNYDIEGTWDTNTRILKRVKVSIVPVSEGGVLKSEVNSSNGSITPVRGEIQKGVAEFDQDAFSIKRSFKQLKTEDGDELPKLRTFAGAHLTEDTIYMVFELDQPTDSENTYIRSHALGVDKIAVMENRDGAPQRMTGYWVDALPIEILREESECKTYTLVSGVTEYTRQAKPTRLSWATKILKSSDGINKF